MILYETHGHVATLTINRPEVMNAFDEETFTMLADLLDRFDADEQLRVAIITGAGERAFSSGADLKKMYGRPSQGTVGELWERWPQRRLSQRQWISKPIIAAINGYCLAGGLELALGCDLRIASETATFGAPEVRWSILHGYGALMLPRTIPFAAAMEMLLTGERISAADALRLGLVSRVVPPSELMLTAVQLAERIAANGPLAVRITKELAWRGLEISLEEGLRLYATMAALMHGTADAVEGPRAFAEKRPPNFQGR